MKIERSHGREKLPEAVMTHCKRRGGGTFSSSACCVLPPQTGPSRDTTKLSLALKGWSS